jgi:hypothetical protein
VTQVRDKFKLGEKRTYVLPFPELKQKPACLKPTITTVMVNGKASSENWLEIDEIAKTLTVKPSKEQTGNLSINFKTVVEGQTSGSYTASPQLILSITVDAKYNSLYSIE